MRFDCEDISRLFFILVFSLLIGNDVFSASSLNRFENFVVPLRSACKENEGRMPFRLYIQEQGVCILQVSIQPLDYVIQDLRLLRFVQDFMEETAI